MSLSISNFWYNNWINNNLIFVDHCRFSNQGSYPRTSPCSPHYSFIRVSPTYTTSTVSSISSSSSICDEEQFKILFEKYLKISIDSGAIPFDMNKEQLKKYFYEFLLEAIDSGEIPSGMTKEQFKEYFYEFLQEAIDSGAIPTGMTEIKHARYVLIDETIDVIAAGNNIIFNEEVINNTENALSYNMDTGIFTVKGPSKWLILAHVSNNSIYHASLGLFVNNELFTNMTDVSLNTIVEFTETINEVKLGPGTETSLRPSPALPLANIMFVKLSS